MTASDAQQVARAIVDSGALQPNWVLFFLTVLVAGIGAFGGAYLAEKGKNSATKEDVAEITRQIENVRSEYAGKIESLKGSYQLRAAALEKRLEIHQEAYVRWRDLMLSVHTDSVHEMVRKCEDWWASHCLYLTPEAREAFTTAVMSAHLHRNYIDGKLGKQKIEDNWDKIRRAGDAIVRGADLPPLPNEAASVKGDPEIAK